MKTVLSLIALAAVLVTTVGCASDHHHRHSGPRDYPRHHGGYHRSPHHFSGQAYNDYGAHR